jgi:hypothetical protein
VVGPGLLHRVRGCGRHPWRRAARRAQGQHRGLQR